MFKLVQKREQHKNIYQAEVLMTLKVKRHRQLSSEISNKTFNVESVIVIMRKKSKSKSNSTGVHK